MAAAATAETAKAAPIKRKNKRRLTVKLRIDGHEIVAKPGQTLLELVEALGLDCNILSKRPVAAKIAGEVFNLN